MAGTKNLSALDASNKKVVNVADGTAASDAATKGQVDTAVAYAADLSNATGTTTASRISDFDTQVRSSRLDQMAAPISALQINNQQLQGVGAATLDAHAPNWGQVKDLISGLRKTDVRVVATGDITLSGTQAIDGVSVDAGDRVLVAGQTAASANGIYVAAAGAWSRATDADDAAEFATQWLVTVREGSVNGDTLWQHNTDGTVTLGTTALTFAKIGPIAAASGAQGAAADMPATAAGASWAWAHGLGTRDLIVQLRRNSTPYDYVECRVEATDANTLTFLPDEAVTTAQYRAIAIKIG